jgi:predicted GNAT family N-acyltransferase
MKFVIKTIADEGIRNFMLEAQIQALPFYEKLGFVAFGDEFLDARIPHRKMRLTL